MQHPERHVLVLVNYHYISTFQQNEINGQIYIAFQLSSLCGMYF